ncbi:hypothetical protein FHR24_002075 [Wenyingzhuangia heitensis]|uniref:Uncharacterized protein n=1 Tax=Wenyingzhuangia heitensis TaxID=1487859 RepID=A0ABX0U9U1_9FLAO|nr:hypothetical protein [Wenyingzhuangia heitensis]NIJ45607.1 hypothetical protein [Wenyingzhuangia heitensis]
MAIVGEIIKESHSNINTRGGEVISDVIFNNEYFQIRTYAMGDYDRKNGSKQNIQLTKEKAIELRKLMDKFIGDR